MADSISWGKTKFKETHLSAGHLSEALISIPRQVLQRQQCAIGRQQHVQGARAEHVVVGVFDDALHQAIRRRDLAALIALHDTAGGTVEEDCAVALRPAGEVGHVQSSLELGIVEEGTLSRCSGTGQRTQDVPRFGTDVGDPVPAEARIDQLSRRGNVQLQAVTRDLSCIVGSELDFWVDSQLRREREVLVHVLRQATGVGLSLDLVHESGIQIERFPPVIHERRQWDAHLQRRVCKECIIQSDTGHVKVCRVGLVQELSAVSPLVRHPAQARLTALAIYGMYIPA